MKVVFDLGRVLLRWRPDAVIRQTLPALAPDDGSAADWAAQIFQSYGGDWGEFDRGTVSTAQLVARIATRTGLAPAAVQAVVDACLPELQPLPDSVALLQQLHSLGLPLFYLSNMPAPFADHLQASHAFMGLFSDGVFSARVGHNKPEPAIYEIAAQRFGGPVHELLFIDDHEPNVVAARQQGWQALHFTSAAPARAELQRLGLLAADV